MFTIHTNAKGRTYKLGSGAFGQVLRGVDSKSGRLVAIKKVPFKEAQEDIPPAAKRELLSLSLLDHPNVIGLIGVDAYSSGMLLALELMATDLARVVDFAVARDDRFSDSEVYLLLEMFLQGVASCHSKSIMHRDLKPSNLLLSSQGVLKIADFGHARIFDTTGERSYSHQVATRWYRAPELLFGARKYDESMDMWSVGAIFAELFLLYPVFRGTNDFDQIFQVFQVTGTPTKDDWPEVDQLPDYGKVLFEPRPPTAIERVVPEAPTKAQTLLAKMLQLNPKRRIAAKDALLDDYIQSHRPTGSTWSSIRRRVKETAAR